MHPKRQKSQNRVILEIRHLEKSFGVIAAVKDCDFTVERGMIVGLIGPNGAGKTTVFNLICGHLKPDGGVISLDGVSMAGLRPHQIAQMGIARTFQLIRLFPNMTVLENMMLAVKDQHEEIWHALFSLPYMRKEERKNEQRCLELLALVGLQDKRDELAKNLSYGQQKLLEIARALIAEPELLMLDEPAGGVNLTMLNKIRQLLLELRNQGKTILLIEHNMEFVMGLCDKVVVLDYGEEIAAGKPAEIKKNKRVLDAYLGGVDETVT